MTLRYSDRAEAGRLLAHALARHRDSACIVYALPRGGVAVGREVARVLHAPLDLMLVRKIGVPSQPELAMGAVADGTPPVVVLNDDIVAAVAPSPEIIAAAASRASAEIARRRALYLGGDTVLSAADRVAIVVDDGLATGATARAALRALKRQKPSRLILAVPVAPVETLAALKPEADEIVCLQAVADFISVGAYYRDFHQIEDAEVTALLAAAKAPPPAKEVETAAL
jgi:putative phosphoribosyl transferase